MVILGIDPGYAITGFGIIEYIGNKFKVKDYGVVSTPASMEMCKRLCAIDEKLNELIKEYDPDCVAIEQLFFNKNTKTALNVAQGRGVAILAGAKAGKPIYEYTPLQIKQSVAGYGRAQKAQVQQMVKILLNLESIPKPDDAADGLAVAICHAHSYKMMGRI